jgi:CBS domain-containing protein
MIASRIGIRNVDVAYPDESAWLAAERMHQRGVGALVVINEAKIPVGIVTDRDLMERIITRRGDADSLLVGDVMTPDPQTIDDGGSVEAALGIMQSGHFRRLPIVDEEGRLCGLVTLDDILIHLANEFLSIGKLLKSETPRAVAEESLLSEA